MLFLTLSELRCHPGTLGPHLDPESDVISDPLRNNMSFGNRSAPVLAHKDMLFLAPSEITSHLGTLGPHLDLESDVISDPLRNNMSFGNRSAPVLAHKDMLFLAPSEITSHLGTLGPHLGPESDVISDPFRINMSSRHPRPPFGPRIRCYFSIFIGGRRQRAEPLNICFKFAADLAAHGFYMNAMRYIRV